MSELLMLEPDYTLAYTITALGIFLGILAICIPRPRPSDITVKRRKKKK